MNKAAIYHRPDSEYAYLYDKDTMHIRLRTAKGDMEQVWLLHGDPYDLYFKHWYKSPLRMTKILSTDCCDYWLAKVTSQSRRLSYVLWKNRFFRTQTTISACHTFMKLTAARHRIGSEKPFGIKSFRNALPTGIQIMTQRGLFPGDPYHRATMTFSAGICRE